MLLRGLNFPILISIEKYHQVDKLPVFNHLNADHLPHSFGFLEIRSSSIVMMICYQRNCLISTRLWYRPVFSVEMPDVFMLVHPVGSIIGHASLITI